MRLLLLLLALSLLPYFHADERIVDNTGPLATTQCTLCKTTPEVTKCTGCEKPIHSKSEINSRCAGTLTCLPGRILIANNRHVIKNVRCSTHSSEDEEVWVGKAVDSTMIAVENAACFITPIQCIALGSFSSRCPRGYECDKVKMNFDQSRITCNTDPTWWTVLHFGVFKNSLWFSRPDATYEQLEGDLECDSKTGSWVRTDSSDSSVNAGSVITQSLICGRMRGIFGLPIEDEYLEAGVRAIQVCLPILLISGICIYNLRSTRAELEATKEVLEEKFVEGKEKAKQNKEQELIEGRALIKRWREINTYSDAKNKTILNAWLKEKKKKESK